MELMMDTNSEYTIEKKHDSAGELYFAVYQWDKWPKHSVLAGQDRKSFIDEFPTMEAALQKYWTADVGYRSANNYVPDNAPGWFDPADAGEQW